MLLPPQSRGQENPLQVVQEEEEWSMNDTFKYPSLQYNIMETFIARIQAKNRIVIPVLVMEVLNAGWGDKVKVNIEKVNRHGNKQREVPEGARPRG
jgi:hypothetical protein